MTSASRLELPNNTVKNQLLYIVYGNDLNYQIETKLSILSILRHTKSPCFTIRVMTDQPHVYEGWPVEVISLNQQILQDWLGNTNYHYRRKVEGILCMLPYAERTVFIDTDTIIQANANELFSYNKNEILVDRIEGLWEERRSDALITHVSDYLLNNYPQVELSTPLINSGVLGFCQDDAPILKQSIDLIDELWHVDPKCRVLEQFCLAISMNRQKILVEHKVIYHYWSKKEFFHQMGKYYFDKYGSGYQVNSPEQSKELLTYIIRPLMWRRFFLRLKVKSYPKKQRSGLLKLLYALTLKNEGYEGQQKVAYWLQAMNKDFLRYNPEAYRQFRQGTWPSDYKKIATIKKQQKFLTFLKSQGELN